MPVRLRSFADTASRFAPDDHGNVALIFALALVPLVGAGGAALDYSRAASARSKLQQAADGASLAAAKASGASATERASIATKLVEAQTSAMKDLAGPASITVTEPSPGEVKVDVSARINTGLMRVMKVDSLDIGTSATAVAPSEAEVALALDTTGSMENDMLALRHTATKFVQTLFQSAPKDGLRISVVPFVASVNPGRQLLLKAGAVDSDGLSQWHARDMRNRQIASVSGCNPWPSFSPPPPPPPPGPPPPPSPPSPPPPPGPPPPPPPPPPKKERKKDSVLHWSLPSMAEVATELFGVGAAQAQTANTNTPLSTNPYTISPPYSTNGATVTVDVPVGFQAGPMAYGTACRLLNPSYMNHLDLFDRIPGTSWKGCVEARPAGLDVKEDPPTYADARFVPYFWPDEPGGRNDDTWSNSYLDEPAGLPGFDGQDWLSILRYNKNASGKPRIVENKPTTYGPNSACPDEILPLSDKQGPVVSRINTLQHYFGGGTISSEGVMWAWRTLSPDKPFGDGKPYGTGRKFIVLMTDGENMISGNNNDNPWAISDYTAYGYLWQGRLGTTNYEQAAAALDNKMTAACNGAKAKGITIITILFRETSPRAVDNVRNCASRPDLFYRASDQAALDKAFQNVAGQISNLRISR